MPRSYIAYRVNWGIPDGAMNATFETEQEAVDFIQDIRAKDKQGGRASLKAYLYRIDHSIVELEVPAFS